MNSPVPRVTRTGQFPIGFRRMPFAWHDDLDHLTRWAKEHRFSVLDLWSDATMQIPHVTAVGLAVGTVDLFPMPAYNGMLSADKAVRGESVATAAAQIRACAPLGVKTFFTMMIAPDAWAPPQDTFRFMVESYAALLPVLRETGTRISIEGWPERRAHCCNPESCRAFFAAVDDASEVGLNYDPSHLIRLGIDPIRFLREFGGKVVHVHGKDTALLPERLYETGWETNLARLGAAPWRYTIPGHGQARWPEIFRILDEQGYRGAVTIEHEDKMFWDDEGREKAALLFAGRFLESC